MGDKKIYDGKEEGTAGKRRVQKRDGTLVLSLGNMDRVAQEFCGRVWYAQHILQGARLPASSSTTFGYPHIRGVAGTTKCAPTDTTLGAGKELDLGYELFRFVNMQPR